MKVIHWKDCEEKPIERFPYKGRQQDVIGTGIRWLSQHGEGENGIPEYGLRFFTIQPGGQIPIHNHFYHQTMFILSGEFECWEFDPETDDIKKKVVCGPGTAVYIPGMQPHGMKNITDQPATFLCCICNIYDEEEIL